MDEKEKIKFWPELNTEIPGSTPKTILTAAGHELMRSTSGKIRLSIGNPTISSDLVTIECSLYVQALSYATTLMRVRFPLKGHYPLIAYVDRLKDGELKARNEPEFVSLLQHVFSQPEITNSIHQLLALTK